MVEVDLGRHLDHASRLWADLVREAYKVGLTPPVFRECFFDEAAALFGLDREREEAPSESGTGVSSGRDVIAERLAHAAGLGPEPEPDPMPSGHPLLAYAMLPPEGIEPSADALRGPGTPGRSGAAERPGD